MCIHTNLIDPIFISSIRMTSPAIECNHFSLPKRKKKKDSISYCCVCFFPQSFFVSALVLSPFATLRTYYTLVQWINCPCISSWMPSRHIHRLFLLSNPLSLSDILRVRASACALCIECALFWHYSFNTGQPRWQSKSSVIVVICLETDKRIETKMNETIVDE